MIIRPRCFDDCAFLSLLFFGGVGLKYLGCDCCCSPSRSDALSVRFSKLDIMDGGSRELLPGGVMTSFGQYSSEDEDSSLWLLLGEFLLLIAVSKTMRRSEDLTLTF